MNKYLEDQADFVQPRTAKRYGELAEHLCEFFGQTRVMKMQDDEAFLKRYVSERKKQIAEYQAKQGRAVEEMTFTTINRELALLRALFNALVLSGQASKNPTRFVTFFQEAPKERILTDEEFELILKTVDACDIRYQHLKPIVLLLLNTAMRLNEVLSIEKSWARLNERLIIVPRWRQKRKRKDKRVPMNSTVLAE